MTPHNTAIRERVDSINAMTRPDGTSRRHRFDTEEAPLMGPLPQIPFTEVMWQKAKVDRNWHICCDYQYYSVPFELIGKRLRVRLTTAMVSIFDNDTLVAEHPRATGLRYRYHTDPSHGPQPGDHSHKALTRDELLSWASSFGPATMKVIKMILDRNAHSVARGLHQANNILAQLGRKHNKATLEPACQVLLDKELTPTITLLKRVQSDIAANPTNLAAPCANRPEPLGNPAPIVDISQVEDAVLIRPASYWDQTSAEGRD